MLATYDPYNRTMEKGDIKEDFYCGVDLNFLGFWLFQLKYGEISLQECYDRIIHEYPEILVRHKIESLYNKYERSMKSRWPK